MDDITEVLAGVKVFSGFGGVMSIARPRPKIGEGQTRLHKIGSDVDTEAGIMRPSAMLETASAPIAPLKPWLKRNRPEMISKMRMTAARVPRATHADIEMIRARTSETMTELFTRVFAAERARVTK